jgi:hypothetical protein
MQTIIKNVIKVLMLLIAFIIFIGSVGSLDAEKISIAQCLIQCAICEAIIFIALRNL